MYIIVFLNVFVSFIFSNHFINRQENNISNNRLSSEVSTYRDENELIAFIESTMQTHLIPGLSISVVKENNLVWEKYFGYSNLHENIIVDENTMFILSSISKTITVTALMQLFEQNFFMLDDNINDYLPFNVIHPDFQSDPITFKMLLSHTSGIKDNWSFMPYYDGDSTLELGYYLQEYLTPEGEFYVSNLNFTDSAPGTSYYYSNIGAALIGYLVEEISNQPFNEFCNENIFEPLEMDNAFWFLSEINNLDQVALPYQITVGSGDSCYNIGCGIYDESNSCFCDFACIDYEDCCADYQEVCGENGTGSSIENLTEYEHYGYSDYPSGQLRVTSNNLAKFMSTYINNGMYNNVRILDSETIELIKTIHYPLINSTQGLVWYYKNQNGRTLLGHNGGDSGSCTEMFISTPNNLGVILLSNSNNYNALIEIENAVLNFAEQSDFSIAGDVNLDYVINVQDIILVVNLILNNQFSNPADLNLDNVINVLDIIQIVNIILFR